MTNAELIKRLREKDQYLREITNPRYHQERSLYTDAADVIEQQSARIAELESGIKTEGRIADFHSRASNEAHDALVDANKRISELEAARIAYASEFAPNADGEPDVGNIHANIRKLKSDAAYWRARAKDAEEYIDESGA